VVRAFLTQPFDFFQVTFFALTAKSQNILNRYAAPSGEVVPYRPHVGFNLNRRTLFLVYSNLARTNVILASLIDRLGVAPFGAVGYLVGMTTTVHLRRQADHEQEAVRCWIVTVSDTRDPGKDTTGQYLNRALKDAGHRIDRYVIVHDDEGEIAEQLTAAKHDPAVQALILHGGTGISKRDVTVPTVRKFLDETIDGFGELFRMISYDEIGPFALMSRALAGVMGRKLVYALPGSENAVRTATEKLLLPTLKHAAFELKK